jgi:hypothetical protein
MQHLARQRREVDQGSTSANRNDVLIAVVFTPREGIRLAEPAGIRYHPDDPGRSDVDLSGGRSTSGASPARTGL